MIDYSIQNKKAWEYNAYKFWGEALRHTVALSSFFCLAAIIKKRDSEIRYF